MPRPCKKRRICDLPETKVFAPEAAACEEKVGLALDEYEALRLIDLEELTQEECAARMGVARATVQAVYARARRKVALCLVHGCALVIGGGDYELCDGGAPDCPRRRYCCKCRNKEEKL